MRPNGLNRTEVDQSEQIGHNRTKQHQSTHNRPNRTKVYRIWTNVDPIELIWTEWTEWTELDQSTQNKGQCELNGPN